MNDESKPGTRSRLRSLFIVHRSSFIVTPDPVAQRLTAPPRRGGDRWFESTQDHWSSVSVSVSVSGRKVGSHRLCHCSEMRHVV
jgi:hypothetical protein